MKGEKKNLPENHVHFIYVKKYREFHPHMLLDSIHLIVLFKKK